MEDEPSAARQAEALGSDLGSIRAHSLSATTRAVSGITVEHARGLCVVAAVARTQAQREQALQCMGIDAVALKSGPGGRGAPWHRRPLPPLRLDPDRPSLLRRRPEPDDAFRGLRCTAPSMVCHRRLCTKCGRPHLWAAPLAFNVYEPLSFSQENCWSRAADPPSYQCRSTNLVRPRSGSPPQPVGSGYLRPLRRCVLGGAVAASRSSNGIDHSSRSVA